MISIVNKISTEKQKAQFILNLQFILVLCALTVKGFHPEQKFNLLYILQFLFFIVFFNFYSKTLKNLNYSFWTFTTILILITINALLFSPYDSGSSFLFNLNLMVLLFSVLLAYIMSSPIFFPRVQWWEYDFRYRGDLKITVSYGGQNLKGRLTDLRRGAGCLMLFEDVPIGEELQVLFTIDGKERSYICSVISKREYSPGRGITYGVKFNFEKPMEKKNFITFSREWEKTKKVKLRRKFYEN